MNFEDIYSKHKMKMDRITQRLRASQAREANKANKANNEDEEDEANKDDEEDEVLTKEEILAREMDELNSRFKEMLKNPPDDTKVIELLRDFVVHYEKEGDTLESNRAFRNRIKVKRKK